MIYVDEGRCTGCGECLSVCPAAAITTVDGVAQIDQTRCRACEACLDACPQHAILAVSEAPELAPLSRVPSASAPISVLPKASLGVRLAASALPWVGTALACLVRDVLPQAASALLDALDRRDRDALSARDLSPSESSLRPSDDVLAQGRRRQGRKRRQRQGRR